MGQRLIQLIEPNGEAVSRNGFYPSSEEGNTGGVFAQEIKDLTKSHKKAIAYLSSQVNRTFEKGDPDFITAQELSLTLASWMYENPTDYVFPEHIKQGIDSIRFVAGF